MENNNLAAIIEEAEGWIGRLKALQAKHDVAPAIVFTDKQFDDFERMLAENPAQKNKALVQLMGRQPKWADNSGPCPNHGNSHCITCMWPRGKVTISGLRDDTSTSDATPEFEQATGYTAVDMTTAAAEGFRDGQASVVVDLEGIDITCTAGWNAWKACRTAIIAAGGKVKE